MVENYKELYQLVQAVAKSLHETDNVALEFQIAKNGSCMLEHKVNKNRMVFMMAKLGDEQKVGYAFFEPNEKQPDWIDDISAAQFDETYLINLLKADVL